MKIAIAGGTGFVGRELTKHLVSAGHDVVILTRRHVTKETHNQVRYVQWLTPGQTPEKELTGVDAFINLAGESLNSGRWTDARKKRMLESRIQAVRELGHLIEKLPTMPSVVINASAIGFYGVSQDKTFTEDALVPGDDFLAKTVVTWEQEAARFTALGIRTVFARLGVVLGTEGGALPKMLLPYKLGIGGKIGSGQQWLSWIHLADVARAIEFALMNEQLQGPINLIAPNPVQNDEFGRIIGHILKRPHWIPVPGFALKLLLGEMSTLVLDGQRVLPKRLIDSEFAFQYPHLNLALENLLTHHKE